MQERRRFCERNAGARKCTAMRVNDRYAGTELVGSVTRHLIVLLAEESKR